MEVRPHQQNMMEQPFLQAVELQSGFHITGHPLAPEGQGQLNYELIGNEYSQIVEITVRPGEVITAEPGTMMYMTPGMGMGADIGGMGQGCKRCCCAGESMFRLHLENKSSADQRVAISPGFPAKIQPVDLRRHSGMVFNRGAFLAALGKNWKVDLRTVTSVGTCCFGGQGLFMNTLHGDGVVFLNAGGTVMTKTLAAGEELIVDHNAVLAFERTVHLDIRRTGSCMVCCCAGQGLFNSVLRGPGFVMVHTMPLAKLRKAIGSAGQPNNANSSGGA
eukprot:TRINITY_DN6054_c0_g1_i1.p1 TRINITY_DN6054_c0_g1~~TRINITY_DN6054_c0_g1_i1.p1  ORF type:complete len:276 (-),score=62.10 TRINITY_DN6054_c0_g1_i1:328-1155(-)